MDIIAALLGADLETSILTESGQIGNSTSKTITYDGNGEELDLLDMGKTFAKVQEEPVDLNKVTRVQFKYGNNELDLASSELEIGSEGELQIMGLAAAGSDYILLALSVSGDNVMNLPKGLYFLSGKSEKTWVTNLEYSEVKTIDPKYLAAAMPKTIDLRNHNAGDDEGILTLNELALMAFSQAMASELGFYTLEGLVGCEAFWKDVSTDQTLRLILDGTSLGIHALLEMNGLYKVVNLQEDYFFGEATQLSGRFMGLMNDSLLQFAVIFDRYIDGEEYTRLTVAVTQ